MTKGKKVESFCELFNNGKEILHNWGYKKLYSESPVNVVDFFCCAGGMSLGFASLKDIYTIIDE